VLLWLPSLDAIKRSLTLKILKEQTSRPRAILNFRKDQQARTKNPSGRMGKPFLLLARHIALGLELNIQNCFFFFITIPWLLDENFVQSLWVRILFYGMTYQFFEFFFGTETICKRKSCSSVKQRLAYRCRHQSHQINLVQLKNIFMDLSSFNSTQSGRDNSFHFDWMKHGITKRQQPFLCSC